MDSNSDILLDCPPFFRQYKDGHIQRLMGTETAPTGTCPITNVTTKDVTINTQPNISARLYLPKLTTPTNKLPILIYIHGGGFCTGSAFNPNPFLKTLVQKSKLLAVSIDYRLAPEHLLPAAYDDCWEAYKWVVGSQADTWVTEHGDLGSIFLFGESAGANIAHNMAMRDGADFAGMVLGHPYFWGSMPVGLEPTDISVRVAAEGLWKVVSGGGVEVDHPWINPLVSDLKEVGCGKVMVCVAEKDVLASRGRLYYHELKKCGWSGVVELVESEEEEHVFFYMKPHCEQALMLLDELDAFFKCTDDTEKKQQTKFIRRFETKDSITTKTQKIQVKNAGIKMKLNELKHRTYNEYKLTLSSPLKLRNDGGKATSASSNFQSLTNLKNNFCSFC